MTRFRGTNLRWQVNQSKREFAVFVAQPPRDVEAGEFATSVMTFLLGRQPSPNLDREGGPVQASASPTHFDHLVFPEMFLPMDGLKRFLELASLAPGTVHVGLQSSPTELYFSRQRAAELIELVCEVAPGATSDLTTFRQWLTCQTETGACFNLAAMSRVDAEDNLRVCIHAKVAASQLESDVTEGELLNFVHLVPADSAQHVIVVHPLICSDAFALPKNGQLRATIALDQGGVEFTDDRAPEYVDLVSIAARTPVDAPVPHPWKPEFRSAFLEMAGSVRYQMATVAFSNLEPYGAVSGSGFFVPGYVGPFARPPVPAAHMPPGLAINPCLHFSSETLAQLKDAAISLPQDAADHVWVSPGLAKQIEAALSGVGPHENRHFDARGSSLFATDPDVCLWGMKLNALPRLRNRVRARPVLGSKAMPFTWDDIRPPGAART